MTDENNLIPNTLWYDPKSQQVVIITWVGPFCLTYRNLGDTVTYWNSQKHFMSKFTCQKHSPE